MSDSRCLCVFSRILGWKVFGGYVDRHLASYLSGVEIEYLDYDWDACRVRVPAYLDIADGLRTNYRLRRLIADRGIRPAEYDAFIFQGHELAIPFRRHLKGFVGIIADATPAITNRRERARTGLRSLVKRVWCALLERYVFRPMFSRVSAFLVLSGTVRTSLIEDYGVDESRIFTVGPPVYERVAAIGAREKPERPVLLFVGNDFRRKGGEFLLELYRAHFVDDADLWIVSNAVDRNGLEPTIRVFANIPNEDVLELMLQSHVFVFPSRHDELGLVLAEAACAGLPIVARESGGQSEYVRTGVNGFLLRDDDTTAWTEAIRSILFDDSARQRLSRGSREIGSTLCTQDRFDRQLSGFLAGLSSGI